MPGPPVLPVNGSIQCAYYTLSEWTAWDGVLAEGQWSIVSDAASNAVKVKIGDGVTSWTSLAFYSPGATNPTSGKIPLNTSGAFVDSSFTEDSTTVTSSKIINTSQYYSIDGYKMIHNPGDNTNNGFGYNSLSSYVSGGWNNAVGNYAGGAFQNGNNNVFFGDYAGASLVNGSSNVFIGNDTYSPSSVDFGIALGSGADLTESNQMVVGGDANTGGIKKAWFGQGVSNVVARIYGIEYHTTSVTAGITNGSAATGNTVWYGARGTGTGAGGHFKWSVAPAGSSGSSQNSYIDVLELDDDGDTWFHRLTATTVPYLDSSKRLKSSAVTPTELGYLSGVTSAIQTQLNALQTGMYWKAAVRVATTTAGTLSTSFENGDTIDGVVLVTGDRILIKDQATASQNGIYIVNASGAPTRATDFDATADKIAGATVTVQEGTTNADKRFTCTTDEPVTVGSSNLTFADTGGTTYIGTSNRITVSGNQIDISANYPSVALLTGGTFVNSYMYDATSTIIEAFESIDQWAVFLGYTSVPSGNIICGDSGGLAASQPFTLHATGGTFGLNSDGSLTMPNASGSTRGLLTNTDWTTFNNKGDAFTTGKLNQFAATSSAELAGVISDETGSGSLVFGTAPTLSNLTLDRLHLTGNVSSAAWTTNGIGIKHTARTFTDTTSTGTVATAYTNVFGGNTIAATNTTTFTDYYSTYIASPTAGTNVTLTRAWSLGTQGNVHVGGSLFVGTTTAPGGSLSIPVRIGSGTNTIDFGSYNSSYASIWFNQSTPNTSNYGFLGNSSTTYLNGTSNVYFAINGTGKVAISSTGMRIGDSTNPSVPLHVVGTGGEPFRVAYDGSNYCRFQISSTGAVVFDAVGSGAKFTFSDDLEMSDGKNVLIDSTTGTKIGSSTSKIGLWGRTPVTQRTGWDVPTGTLSRSSFDSTTITHADLAQKVAALITDIHATGIIAS